MHCCLQSIFVDLRSTHLPCLVAVEDLVVALVFGGHAELVLPDAAALWLMCARQSSCRRRVGLLRVLLRLLTSRTDVSVSAVAHDVLSAMHRVPYLPHGASPCADNMDPAQASAYYLGLRACECPVAVYTADDALLVRQEIKLVTSLYKLATLLSAAHGSSGMSIGNKSR